MTRAQRALALLPFIVIAGSAILATWLHARSGACCYATATATGAAILPALGRLPRYAPITMRSELYPHASGAQLRFFIASMLARESSEHGSPWVSHGDVAVDCAGNPHTIDRAQTCYLTSTRMLPREMTACTCPSDCACRSEYRPTVCGCDHYSSTLPAYNVWHRARLAGLERADYGRTWWIYSSRDEYVEGLN